MRAYGQTAVETEPSTTAKAQAIGLVLLASVITLLTTDLQPPGWVWVLRIVSVLAGVGVAIGLIVRENNRKSQGLPVDRDTTAFDLWTIPHTLLGVMLGAWGLPGLLVLVFTIVWEIFEAVVPGFGDTEVLANRTVDVVVALFGWFALAVIIALATNTQIPWLLPSSHSLLRDGLLHLF